MWEAIIGGGIAGIVYGILGYAKKTDVPDFSWFRFLTTVVLGAVAGGWASYSGQELNVIYAGLAAGGFATAIENFFKALYRRFFKK